MGRPARHCSTFHSSSLQTRLIKLLPRHIDDAADLKLFTDKLFRRQHETIEAGYDSKCCSNANNEIARE